MSTNIPVLTQKNMAERGYPVFMVICPKCLDKWEELVIDNRPPTLCLGCHIPPVEWVTFDKMRRMAEIDLMPTKLFVNYLVLLIDEQLAKGNFQTVAFLDVRYRMLTNALDSYVLIDNADYYPYHEGKEVSDK